MRRELNAIMAIAARDITKLFRDRLRLVFGILFPLIFIGILSTSLQASVGHNLGYNLLTFSFVGILAQTLFQSTASGIISLVSDRETDFAQEIFVSPISRYSILFGKIVGESAVSFFLIISILALGLVLRIPLDWHQLILVLPSGLISALFGGAFGVLVMSVLPSQQSAQQVFPFVLFPQFFLSGVFSPIKTLPPVLFVLSRIIPMTYAVDFVRSLYYLGKPEYAQVVLHDPLTDLLIITVYFAVLLVLGTKIFVSRDRNR